MKCFFFFLCASSQIYRRSCPSFGWSVRHANVCTAQNRRFRCHTFIVIQSLLHLFIYSFIQKTHSSKMFIHSFIHNQRGANIAILAITWPCYRTSLQLVMSVGRSRFGHIYTAYHRWRRNLLVLRMERQIPSSSNSSHSDDRRKRGRRRKKTFRTFCRLVYICNDLELYQNFSSIWEQHDGSSLRLYGVVFIYHRKASVCDHERNQIGYFPPHETRPTVGEKAVKIFIKTKQKQT